MTVQISENIAALWLGEKVGLHIGWAWVILRALAEMRMEVVGIWHSVSTPFVTGNSEQSTEVALNFNAMPNEDEGIINVSSIKFANNKVVFLR